MEFQTYATQELAALAKKLSMAAAEDASAATTKASAPLQAAIVRLRDDQAKLVAENARLMAENAAFSQRQRDLMAAADASDRRGLVERLASVFDSVAAATTVDEVLTAAAGGLFDDFSRVAVFTVRDNRLSVTHRRGFDINSGIEKVVVPLGVDSFLARAAQERRVQSFGPDSDIATAPFGGSPVLAVTIPIAVRGETLAVLYADDAGRPHEGAGSSDSTKLAEILRALAALRLERLTQELSVMGELQAYAQMLIDEVEYVFDADTTARKSESERAARLQENLRCARQLYQQRVTLEGPAASTFLEQAIAGCAERTSATGFGQHVTAVLERVPITQAS